MSEWISRRAFVRGSAIAVVLSAAPVGSLARAATASRSLNRAAPPGTPWARSRFAPFQGATFQMTGGEEDVDVVLAEVGDLRPVRRPGDEKRFSLMFTAARGHAPADGIRKFRNKDFGEIDLFVSPVGRTTTHLDYQVIINRL